MNEMNPMNPTNPRPRTMQLMGRTVTLREDYSEAVNYNFKDFPAYISRGRLSLYPDYTWISHWHEDLEFIAVLSGEMDYNVNGEITTLKAGEGIIVGSRQLHYGFSQERRDCDFICILLHPLLFCTVPVVEQTYVAPASDPAAFSFLFLSPEVSWQARILQLLTRMYDALEQSHPILRIQTLGFEIWQELFLHLPKDCGQKRNHASRQLSVLKDMIRFIHLHYDKKLSLADIAEAGSVCKSGCNDLFRRYLHKSPVAYLIEYRLQQSVRLLRTTDLSVTEIAALTGFTDSSYFTKTFREHFSCSPRDYRKRTNITTD